MLRRSPLGSAEYSYLANSPLVDTVTFMQSSTPRMTTTKSYDFLDRLTQISSAPSASSTVSFGYSYDSANQRTRRSEADGSYWLYNYDALGQVVSGHKYWSDQTPVAGQQFDYGFDDIGNRKSTKAGGDQNGWNLRSANYTPNNLNQYTSRDVPGAVDIMGVSYATNTVTVGGQTAYRRGEYFRDQLGVDNSSAALWTNIVVAATGQTSVTGNVFVVKTPEAFTYDLDGNLTNDGRWTYAWDAENRLTNMTSLSTSPTGSKVKLDFAYDAQGRRIQKIVSTNDGSAYYPQSTNKFIYDGWNLIAVLDPASALIRSFVWGLDLSGTAKGAGGVGGLLAVNDAVNGTNFVAYDGNGNVAALVKASDGTVSANYEYGPFGELLRATGPMARANPFRFSTKYQDDETDLLYYGYRFYNASAGRWLSRDLIGEKGGINLYTLIHNDTINQVDKLGLMTWKDVMAEVKRADDLVKNMCCHCAKGPPRLSVTLTGTASGQAITGSTKIEKTGCVYTIWDYYWWDCFNAQREGGAFWDVVLPWNDPNEWREHGWYPGGPTNTRSEKGKAESGRFDSNHWAWKIVVVYTMCVNERVRAHYKLSDEVQWTWDAGTESWR